MTDEKIDYSKLTEKTWDTRVVSYFTKIYEYKGKQDLLLSQKPAELKRLVEIAGIQSTESSNRIEGVVTTRTRMRQLFTNKATPRNRDEYEILGYRDALDMIHENYDFIPVRPSYILQLHRDLLQPAGLGRSSILNVLKELTEEGLIIRMGNGRNTCYVRSDAVENMKP